ncbi:MAG TPA: aminoacyl-tRNA hydrolase [Candidatus Nanopelagicales bacterium]|nr:aminoacyl-tRNA hydrolase [Candidatus Nanopelagicales bacterium]
MNTSDTRATVSFDVQRSGALPDHLRRRALLRLGERLVDGVLTVTASDQRSQWQNRTEARRRLALALTEATRPPPAPRRPTRPSRGSVERRIRDKKARGRTKRLRRPGAD